MRQLLLVFAILCVSSSPAFAQNQPRSHWGVVGGFAPKWEPMDSIEILTTAVFDEGAAPLLRGSEFRVGIARGRRDSGDWGVSFIRKLIDQQGPSTETGGISCQGGSSGPNQPFVNDCIRDLETRTPGDLQISGMEVHKHFAFVTIKQRVQVGVTIAGGFGVGQGGFTLDLSESRYTCTYPPGTFPDFDHEGPNPCGTGVQGPQTITPTGTEIEPFQRILNYDSEYIPLGKVEVAGTLIVTPQVKVRIGGGFNYPGKTIFGITGIYFFGKD